MEPLSSAPAKLSVATAPGASRLGAESAAQALRRLPPATVERLGTAPTMTVRPATRAAERRPGSEPPLREIAIGESADDDFALVGLLGEGGMGRVLLACERAIGREVAVKALRVGVATPEAAAALLDEGRIAGQLEHPNIVPVHALGRDATGAPVVVMKRVEGTAWGERLAAYPLERNLEILLAVCNAVHFAHTRGVVHLDIKPANVMLGEFGEVYLVDWGVALRLAEREGATELAGTPAYLAPEMLSGGNELSPRTDVYLLGATLHEILVGRPPHGGPDLAAIFASVASPEAPALDGVAPAALAAICRRALDPEPAARFASAADLRDAVVDFLRHRASERLAEGALAGLGEARVAPTGAARRRLLVESHFGLRQALREWPENPAAAQALDEATAELARLEIAEGNRGAAEHLLAGLASPPAAVVAELAALRARLEVEEAGRRRLEAFEQEQDLGVSRRARVVAAATMVAINLSQVVAATVRPPAHYSPEELVRDSLFPTVLLAGLILGARRALARNRINRQVALSALLTIGLVLIHRVGSLRLPRPVAHTLIEELYLISLGLGFISLLLVRWLWAVAAATLVVAGITSLRPSWIGVLYPIASSLPFLGMIVAWWRPRPPAAR